MNFECFSVSIDGVLNGTFLTGVTDYQSAIDKLIPLINKLDIQRAVQRPKFYERLERDLFKNCIMPAITLAFIDSNGIENKPKEEWENFVTGNIGKGFILDGIQRLTTLERANKSKDDELKLDNPLFLNILICDSIDKLLYRMITLNNGQKPMTPRHQVEVLSGQLLPWDELTLVTLSEKESKSTRNKYAFRRADIVSGYLAFLSDSINIDNKKIIEEKMDELIGENILDAYIPESSVEFIDVLQEIARLSSSYENVKWLKNQNNLIGFCAGIKDSYSFLNGINPEHFEERIETFEDAFSGVNASQVRIGTVRRVLVKVFIERFEKYFEYSANSLLNELATHI